jgi:hypothetical protein
MPVIYLQAILPFSIRASYRLEWKWRIAFLEVWGAL